ncbi:uncharacterized protein LOC142519433 [Primulina tabacum]|uniref:uncharacterized protein LOC142519433 n=1 Tax=Primulina tabacum TaxID=48773 RepID=UPI003F59A898
MQEAFAKKWAAEKAAKKRKLAARRAVAEKKRADVAEEEDARRNEFARGEAQFEREATRASSQEESEDSVPLIQRKRKAITSPELILLESNREEDPATSQTTRSTPPQQNQLFQEPLQTDQPTRGNLFLEGATSTGLGLFKQLLVPAEEAYLKSLRPTAKLLEGSNRILTGVQMLISAFEEVAAAATTKNHQARALQELHEQLQGELSRVRSAHEEEMAGLRTALESTRVDLDKARDDINEGLVREEAMQETISVLESMNNSLSEQVELQQSWAEAAERTLAAAEYNKDKWHASFLQSLEFKAAVEDWAYHLFKTGFDKCREQFEEAGLLPEGRENFPDFGRAITSLPKDGEEEKKDAQEEEQSGSSDIDVE